MINGRRTILICDDDRGFRKLIRLHLTAGTETFTVLEAETEREIQENLNKGGIDVVLMDLSMPEKSGEAWLSEIVKQEIAPVVMITGYEDEEIIRREVEKGASGYIPKDRLTRERLLENIELAMEKWERRKLEKKIQEKNEVLVLSAHTVSHDLNNCLNLINGCTELALEKGDLGLLEPVVGAISQAARLIKNASAIQKLAAGDAELGSVELGGVISSVISDVMQPHRVEWQPGKEMMVRANLMVRYLFENVLLHAGSHNEGSPRVTLSTQETEDSWVISIGGTGPGIPDESKEKIFEMGALGVVNPGSGIGLYLAKKLAHASGGDIWIEDCVKGDCSQGSVFKVKLNKLK